MGSRFCATHESSSQQQSHRGRDIRSNQCVIIVMATVGRGRCVQRVATRVVWGSRRWHSGAAAIWRGRGTYLQVIVEHRELLLLLLDRGLPLALSLRGRLERRLGVARGRAELEHQRVVVAAVSVSDPVASLPNTEGAGRNARQKGTLYVVCVCGVRLAIFGPDLGCELRSADSCASS